MPRRAYRHPAVDAQELVSVMANPDEGIKFVLGILQRAGRGLERRISEVQSVLFDRLKWTKIEAQKWLRAHGFKAGKPDTPANYFRYRQTSPRKYREMSTITPGATNPAARSWAHVRHLDGIEIHLGTAGVVIWASDWNRLFQLAEAGHPGLSIRHAGPAGYGHRDVVYTSVNPSGKSAENPSGLRYKAKMMEGDPETGAWVPNSAYYAIIDKSTGEVVRRVRTKSAAIQVLASLNAQAGPWYGDPIETSQVSRRIRANPNEAEKPDDSAAAELYEQFHGREPEHIKEFRTEHQVDDYAVEIGPLRELVIATVTGLEATIKFNGKDAPTVAVSADGKQLYVEGEVKIDLAKLKMSGPKWERETMTLGTLLQITYTATKDHIDGKESDFFHEFAEDGGPTQPTVLYEPKSKQLSFAGGNFKTTRRGLEN